MVMMMSIINALKQRHQWADKHDTKKDFTIIPEGSTVTVQREDGRPRTTVHWWSMSTKSKITDTTRSMSWRQATLSPDQPTMLKKHQYMQSSYLHDEITKAENWHQDVDDFNKLVNAYSLAYLNTHCTQTCPGKQAIMQTQPEMKAILQRASI